MTDEGETTLGDLLREIQQTERGETLSTNITNITNASFALARNFYILEAINTEIVKTWRNIAAKLEIGEKNLGGLNSELTGLLDIQRQQINETAKTINSTAVGVKRMRIDPSLDEAQIAEQKKNLVAKFTSIKHTVHDANLGNLKAAGGFTEAFGARPGKKRSAYPGQFITPATLLRYMQLGWSFTHDDDPPSEFYPGADGYIPFCIEADEGIRTAGWSAKEAKRAALAGKQYMGFDRAFRGENKPFGVDDVVRLTTIARERGAMRLRQLSDAAENANVVANGIRRWI